MVTKLRNFSTNRLTKVVAFILLVGLIVSVITQLLIAVYNNYGFDTVFSEEYIYSDAYRSDVNIAVNGIMSAFEVKNASNVNIKSRTKIAEVKKGMAYIDEDIVNIDADYFDIFSVGRDYIDKTLNGNIALDELDEYKNCKEDIISYRDFIADLITNRIEIYGDYGNRDSEIYYIRAYRDYINNVMEYKSAVEYTIRDNIPNSYGTLRFYYYATNGEQTFSNVNFTDKASFAQLSKEVYFYEHEQGGWGKSGGVLSDVFDNSQWWYDMSGITIYLAFTDGSINEIQAQWIASHDHTAIVFINIMWQIALGVLLFIFLVVVTGRRPNDTKLHLSKIDRIYSDILLAAGVTVFLIMAGTVTNAGYVRYDYVSSISYPRNIFEIVSYDILTAVCSSVCIYICLSLVRKIKEGMLLKHSLIFTVCFSVYDFFKSLFDGRRFEKYPLTKALFYRQVVFISTCAVLVFFTVVFAAAREGIFIIPPIFGIAIIYWYVKGNNKTFEEINRGFNESLEEQMRAERMKIALVTNVSHDLKTPLTSIISYVDLLSKEVKEQNFTNANDYINILAEKSDRLKHIVSDLFDLAKSTSGNIELELETLDMVKLIEQTLADMSDKIEGSELQLKVKLPAEPLFVRSDGKKLYRVLQNVIDNAIKYSLSGTRIFIDLEEYGEKAAVTVKNTAAYEMDFTAEEVLGRFTRGDKSRSTEGSGLGLSIAESFTNACGGKFSVSVDGDQFKILIELSKNIL